MDALAFRGIVPAGLYRYLVLFPAHGDGHQDGDGGSAGEGGGAGRRLLQGICGLALALGVASFIASFNG